MEEWVRTIFEEKPSRLLLCFLILNLSFAIVELLYGMWANSLSLISDSFHMFFDCTALFAGLVASVISKWHSNEAFSYGYVRAEILAGFLNAIFLMFIAFFIFSEALERLVNPPEVHHERLFLVSVAGLIVNFLGMFVFHRGHSHNADLDNTSSYTNSSLGIRHSHSDQSQDQTKLNHASSDHEYNLSISSSHHKTMKQISNDHDHYHLVPSSNQRTIKQIPSGLKQSLIEKGSSQRSVNQVPSDHKLNFIDHLQSQSDLDEAYHHSHKYGADNVSVSTNPSQARIMQGVFLHILADTLGSFGVMISSALISQFGWMIADPISSMLISGLIVASIFPLLRESVAVLMQRTPETLEWLLPICFHLVSTLEGVHSIGETHFWTVCTNEYVGTIKLEVADNADMRYILQRTHHIFHEIGVYHLTVQLDPEPA